MLSNSGCVASDKHRFVDCRREAGDKPLHWHYALPGSLAGLQVTVLQPVGQCAAYYGVGGLQSCIEACLHLHNAVLPPDKGMGVMHRLLAGWLP